MNKKILIVGRSGVGKDTLANILVNDYGMKMVKSYATRPKRFGAEDTHIFIKPEESKNYPNKVAYTAINGYEYFATKEQVEESDIYIIDPKGFYVLTENMPDTEFVAVYVTADPEKKKKMAIARETDKTKAEAIYESRIKSEDAQFSDFERELNICKICDNGLTKNCKEVIVIENDYNNCLKTAAFNLAKME